MNEYYFLFAIAFVYCVVASIEDLKKEEVANWICFSFIAVGLIYRAFYSVINHEVYFLIFGVLGFIAFFGFANLFYYTRVFAGADAKLLMGFGAILPFESYSGVIFMSLIFIFVLFSVGTLYSIVYSIFLVFGNYLSFKREFFIQLRQGRKILMLGLLVLFILFIEKTYFKFDNLFFIFASGCIVFVSFLFFYLKSVEKALLIRNAAPAELTEGDWLKKDVKINGRIIRSSVHGLSLEEIKFIRHSGKSVVILHGIPFVPAFLIALIVMVFFFEALKGHFLNWVFSLF